MFSTFQRIQQYCGFVTTVAVLLAAAISIASLIEDHYFINTPSASINMQSIDVRFGKPQIGYNYKRQEYALMKFDLEADLRPLFTWNTKQVFVYLAATYPGKPYANKVVVWDAIIQDKEEALISLHDATADYAIYDVTGKFNGRNATLSLEWNVQPYVGLLLWNKGAEREKFVFPPLKSTR
ncbi:signal peptidase 22kDa subunit [Lipomyces orientalis]|uniref:Signal peptidase 22kDa subunit n=1 Tax=Lipomyces orientalis TaxID=1233043 RepID=A0ACC3TSA4_9ASCO